MWLQNSVEVIQKKFAMVVLLWYFGSNRFQCEAIFILLIEPVNPEH